MVFPKAFSVYNILQKLLFHGQEYLRAAAPAGPLSYCFGITLLLERNLLPFELQTLNLLERDALELEAGGKPSTWFPPGTRRAVHNIHKFISEVPSF